MRSESRARQGNLIDTVESSVPHVVAGAARAGGRSVPWANGSGRSTLASFEARGHRDGRNGRIGSGRVLRRGLARMAGATLSAAAVTFAGSVSPVYAYKGELHQQLTFLAARQFNRCVVHSPTEPVSALEVRYIAKANAGQAESNVFVRMFRWTYYDRARAEPGVESDDSLLGVIDTRFHDHFDELVAELGKAAEAPERYRTLGRIISYAQDVTSPAHAVPVYTGRWWRFSMGDAFDAFPVDADRVAELVAESCDYVLAPASSYEEILHDAAQDTLTAVEAPLYGMPVTWEVFWQLADSADSFGEYGRAGNNFGRATEFACGAVRCVLLDRDPLYRDFALQRHVAAVIASMRALHLLQAGGPD